MRRLCQMRGNLRCKGTRHPVSSGAGQVRVMHQCFGRPRSPRLGTPEPRCGRWPPSHPAGRSPAEQPAPGRGGHPTMRSPNVTSRPSVSARLRRGRRGHLQRAEARRADRPRRPREPRTCTIDADPCTPHSTTRSARPARVPTSLTKARTAPSCTSWAPWDRPRGPTRAWGHPPPTPRSPDSRDRCRCPPASPHPSTRRTQRVHIELPAIVHRVEAGHRQLALAGTDAAYKNAYAVQPVTVHASPTAPPTFSVPVARPTGG